MKGKSILASVSKKQLWIVLFLFVAFQIGFRRLGGPFEWIAIAVMNVITFIVVMGIVAFIAAFLYKVLFVKKGAKQEEQIIDLEYDGFQTEQRSSYGNRVISGGTATDLTIRD